MRVRIVTAMTALVAVALVLAPDRPGLAQDAQPAPAPAPEAQPERGPRVGGNTFITAKSQLAVKKALKFLSSQQITKGQKAYIGAFGSRRGRGGRVMVATSSLAGLALAAGGNLPGRGKYGAFTRRTVDFILGAQGDTGFIEGREDASRIHGHGFATLFLAQVYGMVTDGDLQESIKTALQKACQVIVKAQTVDGGWGYAPSSRTWDEASTTITQIQGLRAARDAGIRIDKKVIDDAIKYVHRCAVRSEWVDKTGKKRVGYTFKYSLAYPTSRSTFPLTAAAVSVLHGAGRYTGEVLNGGLDWLFGYFMETMPARPARDWYDRFFYYSHFYAAQAFYHAKSRKYWNAYFPKIRDMLVSKQNKNGSWPSGYGEVYGTAIATLILQVPHKYLPIFQR